MVFMYMCIIIIIILFLYIISVELNLRHRILLKMLTCLPADTEMLSRLAQPCDLQEKKNHHDKQHARL